MCKRFTLTAADRKALNEARKVLRKVGKWAKKMSELDERYQNDENADWKSFALVYWKELDKLNAAHIAIDEKNVAAICSDWNEYGEV